jgi:3-oxoadipate enol-lactonase
MPFVTVNGVRLYYELEGDQAMTLVRIFGLGMYTSMHKQTPEYGLGFENRFQKLFFDPRGNGLLSDCPPNGYSMASFVDELRGLLDALGIQSANFIGVSQGANIAYRFASQHSERVRSLILVGCIPEPLDKAMRDMLLLRARLAREGGMEAVFRQWRVYNGYARSSLPPELEKHVTVQRERFLANPAAGYAGWCEAIASMQDETESLAGSQIPTLWVRGERDYMSTAEFVSTMVKRMPRASLSTIAECGHMPAYQNPAAYDAALVAFIEQNRVDV